MNKKIKVNILAFDFEEMWKDMSEEEKELTKKYILDITKLKREGLSKEEIDNLIKINHKNYLQEYNKLENGTNRHFS